MPDTSASSCSSMRELWKRCKRANQGAEVRVTVNRKIGHPKYQPDERSRPIDDPGAKILCRKFGLLQKDNPSTLEDRLFLGSRNRARSLRFSLEPPQTEPIFCWLLAQKSNQQKQK